MKVISIDPGYDRLGIAIIEKNEKGKEILIHAECFKTEAKTDFNIRVGRLGERVRDIIFQYQPDAMAIEGLFFSKNTKTALKVAESRGVIIFQAIDKGIPVYEYTPNQIKVAVAGHGNATKSEVHKMTSRLISLGDKKRIDDEIDAIAAGLTFFATYQLRKLES